MIVRCLQPFHPNVPYTDSPNWRLKTAKTVKIAKHLQNYQIKPLPFLIVEKT